ncbi:hypothetical protein SAMN03080601_01560 [Alkalitalea saponilacus]|uniref:Uncharacterized protein n=1 Tax=Alkalitalea saponilacus TaxID=889453 RepID=A0A1T5FA25_9BACT|nr:hypothetical protein SAMN03080601_01560 [Alkalitalea saponilacus]
MLGYLNTFMKQNLNIRFPIIIPSNPVNQFTESISNELSGK